MTLSRSRSVRPVPTVTELLQERSARVIESSRHTRGTGMGLSGGRIVGEWYEVPDPLASRRWTVVLGAAGDQLRRRPDQSARAGRYGTAMPRVTRAKYVLVPAGEATVGHGTHT